MKNIHVRAIGADKHYMSMMNLKVGFLILLALFTFTVSAMAETYVSPNDIKCVDDVSSSTYQWISAAVVLMCMALLL